MSARRCRHCGAVSSVYQLGSKFYIRCVRCGKTERDFAPDWPLALGITAAAAIWFAVWYLAGGC